MTWPKPPLICYSQTPSVTKPQQSTTKPLLSLLPQCFLLSIGFPACQSPSSAPCLSFCFFPLSYVQKQARLRRIWRILEKLERLGADTLPDMSARSISFRPLTSTSLKSSLTCHPTTCSEAQLIEGDVPAKVRHFCQKYYTY